MIEPVPICTILTIIVTVIVSLRGFKYGEFTERLIFDPQRILGGGEYFRLLTSGLLHLDGMHLFGNMFTLFMFGSGIEAAYSPAVFLFIYLGSILGGSALSLWMHRHHDYRALGASGGACGIMFAWILFFPGGGVGMFFIPVHIPGWIYAIAYLTFSFVAMRRGWRNVGHDAHIGGALIGLLIAAMLDPRAVVANVWLFAGMMAIGGAMFFYLWKNPLMLPLKYLLHGTESVPDKPAPPEHKPDSAPDADEVDAVLDKVSKKGLHSLSRKEREILERASKGKGIR